ncbi:MAG: hypothetical protein H0U49_00895 [Parachlamydiaceae bacterium]|nr:hypothetical protein [Parachlamydiaceae bacterium]
MKSVFSFLYDSEVQKVGTTSKNMCAISRKELQERDHKLEHLLSSYNVTRQFNVQKLKEANLFLIPERHSSMQCHLEQVALTAFLLSRAPLIVILELVPSMEKALDKSLLLNDIQSLSKNSSKGNVYGIGWDNLKEANRLDTKIVQEFDEQNKIVTEKWLEVLLAANEKLPENFFPSKEELPKLQDLAIAKFSPLQPPARIYSEYFSLFMKKTIANGEKFLSQEMEKQKHTSIKENLDLVCNLYNKVQSTYIDIQIKKANQFNAMARKTFPIRTQSMVETLQALKEFKAEHKIPNAIAILIAGAQHLHGNGEELIDPNYDLSPLHRELVHHKAVILLPKSLTS